MEISLFEVDPFSSPFLSFLLNYRSEDLEGLFVGGLAPAVALICKKFPSPCHRCPDTLPPTGALEKWLDVKVFLPGGADLLGFRWSMQQAFP